MSVILHYLLGSLSTKDPFSTGPKKGKESHLEQHVWTPNYIDQRVLLLSRWFGKALFGWLNNTRLYLWLAEKPRWEQALTRVLLGMCDVQLLAGTGILLSGYISVTSYISAYHWQLVVYLAWFSNLTHIACLTALRGYLHQHQSGAQLAPLFHDGTVGGLDSGHGADGFLQLARRVDDLSTREGANSELSFVKRPMLF